MSGGRRRDTPRTVTSRLLCILAAFEQGPTQLSLTEISAHTGMALSTTHRLVGELLRWGALERAADRRYRIGARIVSLAGPRTGDRTALDRRHAYPQSRTA